MCVIRSHGIPLPKLCLARYSDYPPTMVTLRANNACDSESTPSRCDPGNMSRNQPPLSALPGPDVCCHVVVAVFTSVASCSPGGHKRHYSRLAIGAIGSDLDLFVRGRNNNRGRSRLKPSSRQPLGFRCGLTVRADPDDIVSFPH